MTLATTKVALVTGAARGIGRAISFRIAGDGLDVAVNDTSSSLESDEIESKQGAPFACHLCGRDSARGLLPDNSLLDNNHKLSRAPTDATWDSFIASSPFSIESNQKGTAIYGDCLGAFQT
ncbi:hypothetical protein EDB87DRAFT_1586075 [Lactarius vividus]|nr:hypothetical protein EDB87DRAFT_1586075 [Lactarius vividus]